LTLPAGITAEDRRKAALCEACPICRHARKKQRGLAFLFVKKVESRWCPCCKAYEKVHGKKAHESF
jgi:hypothetical protein